MVKVKAGGLTPQGYQQMAKAVGWEPRNETEARDLIINARHNVSAWVSARHGSKLEGERCLVGMGRSTGIGARYAHIADIAVAPDL